MTNSRRKPPPKARVKRRPADDYDTASSLGNDTSDGDEVALTLTPAGTAVFTPQSLRNGTPEQLELAALLQKTVLRRQDLMDLVEKIVADLRGVGTSWNAIGWCVGTTGEAARQRWGALDSPLRSVH